VSVTALFGGELDGVVEQVDEHLDDPISIDRDDQTLVVELGRQRHAGLGGVNLDDLHGVADQLSCFGGGELELHSSGIHTLDVKDVVDQPDEPIGVGDGEREHVGRLLQSAAAQGRAEGRRTGRTRRRSWGMELSCSRCRSAAAGCRRSSPPRSRRSSSARRSAARSDLPPSGWSREQLFGRYEKRLAELLLAGEPMEELPAQIQQHVGRKTKHGCARDRRPRPRDPVPTRAIWFEVFD
jgi:hypothetical protein